jgi:tetratricopeptide (TPR) repeat protein
MGRLEEAVTFYRQAVDIYAKLQDLRHEGVTRGYLAGTLIKLQRFEEARPELQRAIEYKKPYGPPPNPGRPGRSCTTWNKPPAIRRPPPRRGNKRAKRGQAHFISIQSALDHPVKPPTGIS